MSSFFGVKLQEDQEQQHVYLFGVKLQEDQEQWHMSLRSMSSFLFCICFAVDSNGDESCQIFASGFLCS